MSQHRHHQRHVELMTSALECIAQFDCPTIHQIAFWLYGNTRKSALSSSYRLIRGCLGKRDVIRRQGGDTINRYVLTRLGAAKVGMRAGYSIRTQTASLQNEIIWFLMKMKEQGWQIYTRNGIRRNVDFKKRLGEAVRHADALVMDALDKTYLIIQVRNESSTTEQRIVALRSINRPVLGIGPNHYLNKFGVPPADSLL